MCPGIKNSLGIKIHQHRTVQSKVPWLSRKANKQQQKKELGFARAFFPNSLSSYKNTASFTQSCSFKRRTLPQNFRWLLAGRVAVQGSFRLSNTGQSERFVRGRIRLTEHKPLTGVSTANAPLCSHANTVMT